MRFLPSITSNEALMKEFDYEKNQGIVPEEISLASNKKVWWRCEKGHSWQISPNHRRRGSGCPYCANKKVLFGYNDLYTVCPDILNEWDYDKNKDVNPERLCYASNRKIWWRCEKGHSWETALSNRTLYNKGCPFCCGQRTICGENDLMTVNPALASEWDYEKNGNLTPDTVMEGSGKKVWWICKEGHSWEAAVYSRKHNGCPYCSGRKVLSGINDLVTLNPEIASEWDYDKNGELLPEETSVQSNREIWWKCKKGHSWRAAVCDRYNSNGCPVCSGRLRMRTHFIS